MALILQHKSSPVTFDPPVTEESIQRSIAAADRERAEFQSLCELRDADKMELSAIVDRHGWQQVSRWLMSLQAIQADVRRI